MRLFVAIPLGENVREKLIPIFRPLVKAKADVRWVQLDNLHITIKFFGETAESRVQELSARLDRAASQVPAFPLEIQGLDKLPEKGPTRTLIARVFSPDQRIIKLHRLIDTAAGGMGLALDTRVYMPHLTLGRVASNHGLNRLLRMVEKHRSDSFGSFDVRHAVLYQSMLGAGEDGPPRYEALGAFPLHDSAAKP